MTPDLSEYCAADMHHRCTGDHGHWVGPPWTFTRTDCDCPCHQQEGLW